MLPTVFWILEGYRKLYEVRLRGCQKTNLLIVGAALAAI